MVRLLEWPSTVADTSVIRPLSMVAQITSCASTMKLRLALRISSLVRCGATRTSPSGETSGGPPNARRGNVDHLTRAHVCDPVQQFAPHGAVIRDLVLGYVNDEHTDSKLCDILLELDTAVSRNEKIELLLRDS